MGSASADSGLVEGTTLLHYRILKKIGQGGMGEVYLAENTRLKIIPYTTNDSRRFRRMDAMWRMSPIRRDGKRCL